MVTVGNIELPSAALLIGRCGAPDDDGQQPERERPYEMGVRGVPVPRDVVDQVGASGTRSTDGEGHGGRPEYAFKSS